MKKENIIKYLNSILSVTLVALLGAIFTNIGLDWFNALIKPSQWLNNSIIPIIWSIIYSSFIIYNLYIINKNILDKKLFYLLIINGILNVLWCFTFFTMKNLLLGLIIIIINLYVSILLIKNIYTNTKKWSYYLSIYPIWISIATGLNLAIWILN